MILASGSPRRRELLSRLGFSFDVVVSDADESVTGDPAPAERVEMLAMRKAEAVFSDLLQAAGSADGQRRDPAEVSFDPKRPFVIIGADTMVFAGRPLGKPKSRADAISMIGSLQGKTHFVCTGCALICRTQTGGEIGRLSFSDRTEVTVRPMNRSEIEAYVDTGEAYDKAGGYGIQGTFGRFVEGIHGSYDTVVGLPVLQLYEKLQDLFEENVSYDS